MIENDFNGCDNKYSEIMDEIEGADYEKLNEIGEKAFEIMMKSVATQGIYNKYEFLV